MVHTVAASSFRIKLWHIPIFCVAAIALFYVVRLQNLFDSYSRLLNSRKPRDMGIIAKSLNLIEEAGGKEKIETSIVQLIEGNHRNTAVLLFKEQRRYPDLIVQPKNPISQEALRLAIARWNKEPFGGDLYQSGVTFCLDGIVFCLFGDTYHLLATRQSVHEGSYELMLVTNVDKSIGSEYRASTIALTALVMAMSSAIIPGLLSLTISVRRVKDSIRGDSVSKFWYWTEEVFDLFKEFKSYSSELLKARAKAEAFAKDTENITHIFAHDLKAGEIASAKAGEYVTETAKDLIEYLKAAGALDSSSERSLNFIVKYSGRITTSCLNNHTLIDQRNKLHKLAERITPEPHPIGAIFDGVSVAFNRSDGVLTLVDECPDGTMAIVDLALFLSALKNLVKNGFTYNDSINKRIDIKAIVRNRDIVFAVSDNGVGFPPEYLESWGRIQGQAARLDPTREGSGTGLYSVRQIIEAHKGATVELSSEQGAGSVFSITVRGEF